MTLDLLPAPPQDIGTPTALPQKELKARGHNVTVSNAGVAGDTTAAGLARLDWSVGDDVDAVIVELGANDALRGIDPKVTRDNLQQILAKLKARNIPVLFAGMRSPANWGDTYAEDFDVIFPDLAKEHEVLFYPFFLEGVILNAKLNQAMIARALELLDVQPGERVLDLFCGLGNFTLPLARASGDGAVVGVEGDAGLVARAKRNAEHNGMGNLQFFAADLAQDLAGQAWLKQGYDKLLLDPARSGAIEVLKQLPLKGLRRIVYVSCHPGSLARDAGWLVNEAGWTLREAGVMDMFPHTAHVESIAVFDPPKKG